MMRRVADPSRTYRRLLWLTAVIIVGALLAGAATLFYLESCLVAAKGEALAVLAADVANQLDQTLFERYGDIHVMASTLSASLRSPEAQTRYLHDLKETYLYYRWLGVTDAAGRIVAATDPASVGQDRSGDAWFQAVRDGQAVHLQDAQVSPDAGGVVAVGFSAPLRGPGGKFLGAVTARIGLAELEDIVGRTLAWFQVRQGGRTEWQILARDGRLIVDSLLREEEGQVSLSSLPSVRERAPGESGFAVERHLRRSVRVVTGYARSQGYGEFPGFQWDILVRMDRDDVLAPIWALLRKLSAAGLLIFLPLVGVLMWTASRLRIEQEQTEHQLDRLQGLNRVSRALQHGAVGRDEGFNFQEVLELVLRTATNLTKARYGAVGIFDEGGKNLVHFVTVGIDDSTRRAIGPLPSGHGLLGFLGQEADVLRLRDLTRHPTFSGFPPGHPPMSSFLGVSIRVHGRVLGRIYLTNKQGAEEFSDLDEQVLAALATEVGVAIEEGDALTQLRTAEALYRSTVNSLPVAVVRLDQEGTIRFANGCFYEWSGRSEADTIGLPLEAVLPLNPIHELRHVIHTTEGGPATHAQEVDWVRPNGERRVLSVQATGINPAAAAAADLILIIEDMTDRKRAQERQAHLEGRLRQAQKMETVGQLAGGIAHDFNNLLTVINGYADMLVDTLPAGGTERESVEQIRQAGERASALTQQLLTFSRRQAVQLKRVDLHAALTNIQPMLTQLLGEDVVPMVKPAADRALISIDPGQLDQVIMNLAINARDAMPRGGHLTLETRLVERTQGALNGEAVVPSGTSVQLTVTDTGCGMDAETLTHIFEPFFTTKGVGKGTGLGLATVYGIVTQSGGVITVASEPGQGTCFTIELPCVEAQDEPAESEHTVRVARGGTATLLLVEDESGVRQLVTKMLTQLGYRVLEAGSGEAALTLAAQHADAIQLLVTDVVMPGMSGPEVAQRLTALYPALKVLYLSGYPGEALTRYGVAFLPKPFTREALARAVRQALGPAADEEGGRC